MPLLPLLCCRVGVLSFGCRGFPCPPQSSTYITHTFHYTHTGGERGGGGVRLEVLRVELRGSTRLPLLEGASSHTRAPNGVKLSKFAKLVVCFHALSPACPDTPSISMFTDYPPFLYHFTSLTETRYLASQETPIHCCWTGCPVCQCVDLMQTKTLETRLYFCQALRDLQPEIKCGRPNRTALRSRMRTLVFMYSLIAHAHTQHR